MLEQLISNLKKKKIQSWSFFLGKTKTSLGSANMEATRAYFCFGRKLKSCPLTSWF